MQSSFLAFRTLAQQTHWQKFAKTLWPLIAGSVCFTKLRLPYLTKATAEIYGMPPHAKRTIHVWDDSLACSPTSLVISSHWPSTVAITTAKWKPA
ncbi:hypothetical protein CHU98_g373 [Xylaria longipes]|nr:hypothetical protein CHU98_g373 [Xylaria longipes]